MRTTAEFLIAELDAEKSKCFALCCLVVGFENRPTFVLADEKARFQKLKRALKRGGEPIGIIRVSRANETPQADALSSTTLRAPEPGHLSFYSRPILEHVDDQWAQDYLRSLFPALAFRLQGKMRKA